MSFAMPLMRRGAPEDPGWAVMFFSLVAAAGFAFGWLTEALLGVF